MNNLYMDTGSRLEKYFPPGSRDLDWDVLPSTLEKLARQSRLISPVPNKSEAGAFYEAYRIAWTQIHKQLEAYNPAAFDIPKVGGSSGLELAMAEIKRLQEVDAIYKDLQH